MAEADHKDNDYDGPWIERRIDYKCPDKKRHDVVLFGSWNAFAESFELEYQGKSTYATTCKLPLGSYYYRFLIDGEDWETNNKTVKTVKDGNEFNTINVRETEESDEEDEDEEDEEEEDAPSKQEQSHNTQLIFDQEKQKFVVGKQKRKRRGRQSMELDLGTDFTDEAAAVDDADAAVESQQEEEDEPVTNDQNTDDAGAGGGGDDDDSGKKKRRKKKKTRKYNTKNKENVDIQAEKEWARYVFVQQLRQQQQHNDEINRVKTLWKQERAVRVEMHAKVVREKKKLQKDLISMKEEVERLQKLREITTDADKKMAVQLEKQNESLTNELASVREELRKAREEANDIRKELTDHDKSAREKQDESDTSNKKLSTEFEQSKSELASLKATNESLQSNLDTLKEGNKKTMDYQTEQLQDVNQRWEDDKNELNKLKEETKKYKTQITDFQTQLNEVTEGRTAAEKKFEKSSSKCGDLEKKVERLKSDVTEAKNSKEAEDKMRVEVEKVKSESDASQSKLNAKIEELTSKIDTQKAEHAKEIETHKVQAVADIAALQASDNEMNQHLDTLKKQLETKDGTIHQQKENIDKLASDLGESKQNNEEIEKKLNDLTTAHDGLTKDKATIDFEITNLKEEIEKQKQESDSQISDLTTARDAAQTKVENLQKDLSSTNDKLAEESKEYEASNTKLTAQIATMTESLNSKSSQMTDLSGKLTEAEQQIGTLTSSETSLKNQVTTLEKSLANEQSESVNKGHEYQSKIDDLGKQMDTLRGEKDGRITELENEKTQIQSDFDTKLKEFNNAERTIQELKNEMSSIQSKFDREKAEYESQLENAREKDTIITKSCRKLTSSLEGLRDELKAVKDENISQLEEMVAAFEEISPVLSKVFSFNQTLVDDLMVKYKRELTLRRKYFNIVQDLRGNIRVFCRVRPLLKFELDKNDTECTTFPEPGKIVVKDGDTKNVFEFDQVYKPGTTQADVSEDTTEYIQSVMDGYNVSIFAYGQTGSGKTFTMDGPPEDPGVNARALSQLFKIAQDRAPQFEYTIKVAIFEIYNEAIRDLIAQHKNKKAKKKKDKTKASKNDFKILHLPDGSVEVQGLAWVAVKNDSDVSSLASAAKAQRTAGVTDMNAHSSRSHMLLVVDVRGYNKTANIEYLGKLYLVDLAGSERVKKSNAVGQALEEAKAINKSLSALGDVMQSLQKKDKFVPYRNSTLTDLMTNSLGGNAKTVMFINCCPTAIHAFETASSLKFAQRVGKVELGQAKAKSKKRKEKN